LEAPCARRCRIVGRLQVNRKARRSAKPLDKLCDLRAADLAFASAAERKRRLCGGQFGEQRIELELSQQFTHGGLVDAGPGELLDLGVDRYVGIDADELASQFDVGAMRGK